jgi:hypothetical protein
MYDAARAAVHPETKAMNPWLIPVKTPLALSKPWTDLLL